ncbi:MAG: hypothetical protein EOP84_22725, partial [Verrucomicrobiaceae bacterium]
MRTGHYTRLKGRVTYFRRKIPEFLQVRLESTEICYRLGVVSSKLAERLGRRLAVEVDMFFEDARTNPMLNAADLTQLVETAILGWRETANADIAEDVNRFGKPLTNPRDSATTMAEMGMALIQRSGGGASAFDAPFVTEMAERAGLPAIAEDVAVTTAGRALTMGLATHYLQSPVTLASMHGLANGWRGLPVADWQQRLAALEQHLGLNDQGQTRYGAPPLEKGSSPAIEEEVNADLNPEPTDEVIAVAGISTSSSVIFSELVEACLEERIRIREVKPGLRQEMASSLKIWLQVAGDKPIGEYTRTDFVNFRSALLKTPKIYWKSDASRKLSIFEVIDRARHDAIEEWTLTATAEDLDDIAAVEEAGRNYTRLSGVTVNRHLSTIAPVFDWAARTGKIKDEARPFWDKMHVRTGIKVTGLKPNQERPPYTHDQILEIAQHPIWTGRKSDYFYNAPGKVLVRDSLYWGFPIALLHGLRREEFAQLKVKHIRQIDGIWVFDLHEIEVDVKLGASRRYVPLHSKFLALGFLEAAV